MSTRGAKRSRDTDTPSGGDEQKGKQGKGEAAPSIPQAAPAPAPVRSSTLGLKEYKPNRDKPKGRFSVKWELETSLVNNETHDRQDHYLHHYLGKLVYKDDEFMDDEDEVNDVVAGRIKATKIRTGNIMNSAGDAYTLCDDESEVLCRVGLLINRLNGDEDYSTGQLFLQSRDGHSSGSDVPFINEVGGNEEITQGDILYIDEIFVEESFRGLGLGLFLLDHADHVINSNNSLCLLIPYPLQYDGRSGQRHPWDVWTGDDAAMPPDLLAAKNSFYAEFEPAKEKLRKLYALLGFKTLNHGKNNFMGRWNGYRSPSIKKVCPHLYK
jgi:hypothetical protein